MVGCVLAGQETNYVTLMSIGVSERCLRSLLGLAWAAETLNRTIPSKDENVACYASLTLVFRG